MKERIMIGIFLFLLVLLIPLVAFCDPCDTEPDGLCGYGTGNYGCYLGEYEEVTAYSNGGFAGTSCGNYQCVKFMKRFYSDVYGINIGVIGVARNIYSMAENFHLYAFPNGGDVAPHPGDILVFDHSNDIGHVAIITNVTQTSVGIIEQNWSASSCTASLEMTVSNEQYDIDGRGTYSVIGWVRSPIAKALKWLSEQQNETNGSWQNHVGYTAMASLSFLNAGYTEGEDIVSDGIQYLLSNVRADGGIYGSYSNYETALSILALKATGNADYDDEIANAANYLKSIQSDDSDDPAHSWYGGWGYGAWDKNNWSDLSNSQFSAMALDAAEVPKADIVWTRFLRFLSRVQNLDDINDMPWADGRTDGGFTYSPHVNLFNYFDSYGSMTSAGLWGLRLSGVEVADDRVQAALGWLESNEDLNFNSNPMWGDSNRYYYYMAFAKAMAMCFLSQDDTGTWYESWYDRLKEKIASEQHPDGYWNQSQGMWVDTFWALLTLQTQQPLPANLWMSIILASPADLVVYDPQDRVCSKDECNIPGATFEVDDDGNQVINLTELEPGHYRFVFHGTGDGTVHLTVNGHRDDDIISTVTKEFEIKKYEVWESDALVSSLVGALTINVEDPTPPPFVPVCIDIQPNTLNVRSKGVLPVAILGTEVFDVTQIDPDSVYLEGVYRERYNYEDVTGPHDCESPDGNVDMTLKFDRKQIIPVIGDVNDGDVIELTLTGNLKSEFGGTPIQGTDTIIIEKK